MTLRQQASQWQDHKQQAERELGELGQASERTQEESAILAAQVEDQAQQLPQWQEALRLAQAGANEQRTGVSQIQQQIQVLAAEQRSVLEQMRQIELRRERLSADQRALQTPDAGMLQGLEEQWELAKENVSISEARLHELQDAMPGLEQGRRDQQQVVNAEASRQAALSARLEALKALQDKVKTDGKLQPWLRKHGLESLAGLWSRIHVELGWENALEAALRERLAALEVSRLETVQAFDHDAPPAKLAFYKLPEPRASDPTQTLPR